MKFKNINNSYITVYNGMYHATWYDIQHAGKHNDIADYSLKIYFVGYISDYAHIYI